MQQFINDCNILTHSVSCSHCDHILDVPAVDHIVTPFLLQMKDADENEDDVPGFVVEGVVRWLAILIAVMIWSCNSNHEA